MCYSSSAEDGIGRVSWAPPLWRFVPRVKTNLARLSRARLPGLDSHSMLVHPCLGADVGFTASGEKNISQDAKFHTTVTGDNPADLDWGDRFRASFTLAENTAQQSGIPTQLTVVVLLERENDDDFEMIPQIEVTPNFVSRLMSLGSTRSSDSPVYFNVEVPPVDKLSGAAEIDPNNLGAVDLDKLWICTMYTLYADEVKKSATRS